MIIFLESVSVTKDLLDLCVKIYAQKEIILNSVNLNVDARMVEIVMLQQDHVNAHLDGLVLFVLTDVKQTSLDKIVLNYASVSMELIVTILVVRNKRRKYFLLKSTCHPV